MIVSDKMEIIERELKLEALAETNFNYTALLSSAVLNACLAVTLLMNNQVVTIIAALVGICTVAYLFYQMFVKRSLIDSLIKHKPNAASREAASVGHAEPSIISA